MIDAQTPTILLMITKNTSTLDYAVPLFWKIRQQYPGARLAVLYCALSRRTLLRNSSFYSGFFQRHGIAEYDLANFARVSHPMMQAVLRSAFARLVP